jgi:ASC-1-like (ASCH) protein
MVRQQPPNPKQRQQTLSSLFKVRRSTRDPTAAKAAAEEAREAAAAKSDLTGWSGWSSGEAELAAAKRAGRWPDGQKIGRGHGQPYLQPVYAHAIRDQSKSVEGRPGIGWAASVSPGDWITFKITASGGKKLVARALQVRRFDTFESMLRECGVEACLPGLKGGLQEGVRIYQSFGTMSGATYAELESEHGAIAIDVAPLRPKAR